MKMEKVLRSALLLLLAAALCLSMAACTQTPAESSPVSETQTPETAASEKASPEDDMPEDAGTEETPASDALSSALPVKTLRAKRVDENPYMAKSDANIHHDGYNTDSTDEVLPLGIYPEINVSYEKTNANASPAIYFDSYGHAVVPLLGGIAIRDLNAEETKTLGYFSPKQHDGGGYVIQSSYTFLDAENRIVCPTSNNHVLMLRATDEAGNVLPEFEKVLDIDIKAAAEAALGKELTQNLLSVVFDYDGNLWFATGGFRIYPERQQQGVLGYIARSAIDAILSGEQTDLSDAVFVYELTPGEGAENGIAASKDGAVILTNQNCYLLRAEEGVNVVWCTPYESVGAKVSHDGDKTTGGGLAWGGGCSPTLTPNLVLFTDNADPVKLLALFDLATHQPIVFAREPGNLVDVSSIENTLKQFSFLNISKAQIVTHTGYNSQNNIRQMLRKSIKFLTVASIDLSWVNHPSRKTSLNWNQPQAFALGLQHPWNLSSRRCRVYLSETAQKRRSRQGRDSQ